MRLEDQVVSLELAKRLKELGVKQDGYFAWAPNVIFGVSPEVEEYALEPNPHGVFCISAFTVAEMGEMLPPKFPSMRIDSMCNASRWIVQDERLVDESEAIDIVPSGATQAEAMAAMLIHLIEQGLVKV